MQHLLTIYHPDVAPLAQALRAALEASVKATAFRPAVTVCRWTTVLARVSDESRTKFLTNLDEDLDWLLDSEPAAWVKTNVTDVEAFRATAAGQRARDKVGMRALYAPGSKRLIGGWLARDGWLFLFLLSSAAKSDLPQNRNAATEAIVAALVASAHDDPHDADGRPVLHAHALDRIVRDEGYAWTIFGALTHTYALVNAAGRPFDALGPNSKDEWTLISFGAARGRDDIARRFLLSRLNKARAGNWPSNTNSLPRGFMASSEPDAGGRFNLDPAPEEQSARRPVPDPRQRWEVQVIAGACLDPGVTTWAGVAQACGAAGLTSRGAEERETTLDALRDLTSVGRLLVTVAKVRAYCTGLLWHTEKGVTGGQFSPGDGHRLTPRFPGDDMGQVTYDVRVGRPQDHGWDWGVAPAQWRAIMAKLLLPDDFAPDGWSWDDDPAAWDWPQLRDAAGTGKPQDTGARASKEELRPFSGLIGWSDPTHRHLLHCTGSTQTDKDRYTWRREAHTQSRRNTSGAPYRMASTDGETVCSWAVAEFHQMWADLALGLFSGLIATHPDATISAGPAGGAANLAHPGSWNPNTGPAGAGAVANHQGAITKLENDIAERAEDARVLRLSAAHKRATGDEKGAEDYENQSAEADRAKAAAKTSLADLHAKLAAPPAEPSPPQADFATAAAVIAALSGPFATGPAPKTLHTALDSIGATSTQLEEVDAATVRLSVTVRLLTTDGVPVSATGHTTARRSRPNRNNNHKADAQRAQAKAALARKWFYDGIDSAELARLAGASVEHARRIVREQLATGTIRTVGQAGQDDLAQDRIPRRGLRMAITAHPIPAAKAALWAALNPTDPTPAGLRAGYAALIEATYRQKEHSWDSRHTMLDPRGEHRSDALTVLRAMPNPTAPIPSAHLAALLGVPVRYTNLLSTATTRTELAIPASLDRVGGWGGAGSGNLPASERTVALIACPWTDCPSPTADAVLLLPETVIGAEASVICRQCLRTPTRNVAFPEAYRDLLTATETHTGTWVHCPATGCTTDLGAGPGLMWRWDDAPPQRGHTHPSCTPASQAQPTNPTVRLWASGHGYPIADRGRIPADVRAAYNQAHPVKAPTPVPVA